jgi:hypothetical protein
MVNSGPLFCSTRREFLISAAAASTLLCATPHREIVRIVSAPSKGIQPQVAVSEGVVPMVYFGATQNTAMCFVRDRKISVALFPRQFD